MASMPTTVEEMNTSWLSARLGEAGALHGGEVTHVRAEQIGAGVGIMGLLYRLHLDYEPGAAGPASVVAKLPSPDPAARHVARTFRFYEKEVGFYRAFAEQTPIGTPAAFVAEYAPDADDFCLLMSEVTDATVHSQVEGCPPVAAVTAARALARHHAAFADRPVFDDPGHAWLPFGSDSPIPEGVVQGVSESWEPFRAKFPDQATGELEELVPRYLDSVRDLLRMPEGRPVTLLHGDYRLDNLFFGDGGDVTAIDWQICVKGPCAYDLAYFVTQSLTVEDRRAHEAAIIDAYLDELGRTGVDHDRDDFMTDYRRTTMFCLCYPLQSGSLELVNDRAHDLVRDMYERSMAAIRDHEATEFLTG